MSHQFRAALATLLLLGSMLVNASAVAAHRPVPGIGVHLSANCSTSTETTHQIWIDPLTHTDGLYDFVGSTVTVRPLEECSNQNPPGAYGWTIVNAANMHFTSPYGLAQFGFGACSEVCNNAWPAHNVEEFWYTPCVYGCSGNNPGTIYAATWVDFNNNGVHDLPVNGRNYQFSIEVLNPNTSSGKVKYCVKDLYQGLTDCLERAEPLIQLGFYPWWSYEHNNQASTIGTREGDGSIDMRAVKYSTSSGGVITMTGTKTIYGDAFNWISSWTDTDASSYTHFHVYTLAHS